MDSTGLTHGIAQDPPNRVERGAERLKCFDLAFVIHCRLDPDCETSRLMDLGRSFGLSITTMRRFSAGSSAQRSAI